MRAFTTILVVAAPVVVVMGAFAGAAVAQNYQALTWANDAQRLAAEQALRQRDITITNDLARLDAQVQTNQALAGLAAQQARSVSPPVPRDPNAPPPVIDVSQLTSIPDAALADSNAKVRAAAANRK
jgi:hypothetical protein